MMKPASQGAWQDSAPTDVAGREERIAPAPRISVQAFCETVETAAAIQAAGEDRRMAKAHLRIQMGGLIAAVEAYQNAPTPNVIILESDNRSEDILNGLDQLAPVCDAQTRVVIIGRMNDVALYRELVRRGVSDYLIAPVGALQVVRAVCGLFSAPDAKPVGRIIAVVGAKGGVGASTIAHNVAFSIARDLMLDSVVTDLDLAFGTAGLDFNQDPPQGIAEAVFSPDRIDNAFIDRLLSKCTDHLSLLAAPATLDHVYDFGADAFEAIFDSLRATVPSIVLDVPHQWSGWTKHSRRRISPTSATPKTSTISSRPRGPTINARSIVSIRSAYRNARRSRGATSPRRSTMSRSPSFRSSRSYSVRPPTTVR